MINRSDKTWMGIGAVVLIGVFLGIGFLAGRASSLNTEARGFQLPAGDLEAGRKAFADLGCMGCHSINKPLNDEQAVLHEEKTIALGGAVRRLRTHGELVTAIIHPNCTVIKGTPESFLDSEGNSTMPDWTDRMTTQQLIDLVTYLNDQYVVVLPDYSSSWTLYDFDVGP